MVPWMCRRRRTESRVSGMSMPDKEEPYISADGQRACLVPSNPGHGGMPQVDDVMRSGLAADQGGAWEQYASMTGMSCPGQRRPWRHGLTRLGVATGASLPGGDQGVWPQYWCLYPVTRLPLYKEPQGLLRTGGHKTERIGRGKLTTSKRRALGKIARKKRSFFLL